MQSVGYAALEVIPSMKGFEGRLSSGTSSAMTRVGSSGGDKFGAAFSGKATSAIRSKFTDTAKFIVAPLVGAFALEKIGGLIKDSIGLASDLNESQNKVQQVFKSSTDEVFRFTKTAANSFGQSNLEARDAAATFGIFGRAAGLSDQKTAKFAIRMDKLAGDLASFHNTSPEQAIEALGAALRGETEPIRAYGVLLNQTSIKAEALQMGLLKPVKDQAKIHAYSIAVLEDQKAYNKAVADSGKSSLDAQKAQATLGTAQEALRKATEGTVPQLTQQQQVLAAQSLIMKQTAVAQGDFSRTSGGLANQQRILSANIENAKTKLGKAFLPIVLDVTHALNKQGIPAIKDFTTWFGHDGKQNLQDFADKLQPLAQSVIPALKTTLHDTLGVVKTAAPHVKAVIDAFNGLPDWAQKAIVIGGAAGYLGKKTGALSFGVKALSGGGPGGIGGLTSAVKGTPVDPVWVKVVNGLPSEPGGKTPPGIVDPRSGANAGKLAEAEAEAAKAAKAAAEAAKAAGGGVASQSQAAARAFKEAMAAHDVTISKSAMEAFAREAGFKGFLRTILAAPAGVALGSYKADMLHPTPITGIGSVPPPSSTGAKSWADLDKTFTHLIKSGNIQAVEDKMHTLAVQGAAIAGSSNPAVGYKALDEVLPKATAKLDKLTAGQQVAGRGFRQLGQGANSTLDQATTKTQILDARLRGLPKSLVTKLQVDTREARRQIAEVHAMAGRPMSATYNIELAGRPSPSAMDGVRR